MKPMKMFRGVAAFFCCLPLLLQAQTTFYQHDTTLKVYAWGQEQTLAWCGGFNNPQFSMGDINHDGLQDLVVFEPWNSVRTFVNMGSAGNPNYRYAPEYALKFPPVFDYLVLADYNCDGIPDLFNEGNSGFEVYRGYYNSSNQLCFVFYTALYYNNDPIVHGTVNAFNNPGDIPGIVDVDGDGDLDFISYDISGGKMNLYMNRRVELNLPCDSIHIELRDECWGKVYQGFYRTHIIPYYCDNSRLGPGPGPMDGGDKKTHSGNTPCLFDWDMDGDYDYLDGSVSFNEMTFLKNGRMEFNPTGHDTMVMQDTMWQSFAGGKQIELSTFPAAFNVDIDQDGKKDLLIAPNAAGVGSENYKCIWFYKNFSTPGTPDWRFQSDTFLTDKTIDLGTASYPMFFDYNKDGNPDLFIGSDGYYQTGGGLKSRLSYYLNTSTTGHPSYTLQTTDFMGLSGANFRGAAPAFGDIDDDGKADMLIGHADGTLSYYKNAAAFDTVAPNWVLQLAVLTDMNGDTINVGGHAAPFVYDIDRDGKKDLICGNSTGYLVYYQNVSTVPGTISLKLINSQLGGAKADSPRTNGCYSAPYIGKIDSTGVEYLLMGSGSGMIYIYTGFQSGDTTARYTLLDSRYSFIDTSYSVFLHSSYGCFDGLRSTVAVGDVNGDGNYYMVVGNNKGGCDLYKRKVYIPVIDHTGVASVNADASIRVYPNPADDMLHVSWAGIDEGSLQITVLSMTGQVLITLPVNASAGHASMPVLSLANGMYVCVVQSAEGRHYNKFTVVR